MDNILREVESYYTDKILEHGISPKGVDWNSEESQYLRFEQLTTLLKDKSDFSILDYGCGYGALLDFLKVRFDDFEYLGYDISNEMLNRAKEKNPPAARIDWAYSLGEKYCDFAIASGIFNVKLNQNESAWKEYIVVTLKEINKRCIKGFSFNMLTSYSDREYQKDYLFYADPTFYFDYCKKTFSKYVSLLHDYPLYEFTIIVKK